MAILITGGLGFIGSHLSRLLQDQYEVHLFDRLRVTRDKYYRGDINDYYSLERVFTKVKPDTVVHLAGMVSRKECEETPSLAISTNVGGTYNVCSLSHRYGARLIYSGSSEEYGTALHGGAIVDEDTPLGEPTGMYGMTKRMAEEIVQYFSRFKGLEATALRIFMLYGPREEPSDYRSALIRFVYWALNNEPLTVHRNTERSWCYISDGLEAMKRIIEREQPQKYEVFNVGREDPIPTKALAQKIIEVCHSSSEIRLVEPDPTVIPIKRASFRKIKEVLGWEASTPLSYGLEEVAASLRRVGHVS